MQKIEIIEAVPALPDGNAVQSEDDPAIEKALLVWKDGTVGFVLLTQSMAMPTAALGQGASEAFSASSAWLSPSPPAF